MVLYDYFRSTAAYRVRIVLGLKGIVVERRPVRLLQGEQGAPAYLSKNPQKLVPALELDDGRVLTQSLAIIDYLERVAPDPRLLPEDPVDAARVRAVALAIACDIHPLGNLRVVSYLKNELKQQDAAIGAWRRHWVLEGFRALEALIDPGRFCFGATPSLADVCLAPQVYYAERFEIDLAPFPKIGEAACACRAHPAFIAAHPSAQSDSG